MKVTYSVILLLATLTATLSLPANKNEEKNNAQQPQKVEQPPQEAAKPNKDVDFVRPPGGRNPPAVFGDGVVDVDAGAGGFFGNPFGNPFPSLFGSVEAMMTRLRQQLAQVLGHLPDRPEGGLFPVNFGGVDLGKGNTTSVTKVIDGHKVTINETEYKQEGENGGAVFKVRIIDVHPDSAEGSTDKDSSETVTPNNRDRESVEDTVNNEIPKTRDNEASTFENIESFDEVDVVPPHHRFSPVRRNPEWTNAHAVESIEDNSIDAAPMPPRVHDLSNDIYVNQLLADSGAPTNPDAEVFDVAGRPGPFQYYPHEKSEKVIAHPHKFESLRAPIQLQGGIPTNYPQPDFERVGLRPIAMDPSYIPMPYFAPVSNPQIQPRPVQPIPLSKDVPKMVAQEVSTASQTSVKSSSETSIQSTSAQQSSIKDDVPNVTST